MTENTISFVSFNQIVSGKEVWAIKDSKEKLCKFY